MLARKDPTIAPIRKIEVMFDKSFSELRHPPAAEVGDETFRMDA